MKLCSIINEKIAKLTSVKLSDRSVSFPVKKEDSPFYLYHLLTEIDDRTMLLTKCFFLSRKIEVP